MDYTDAVAILERVVRHLKTRRCSGASTSLNTERYHGGRAFQKRAGSGEKLSEEVKAFYMRLNEDGKTVAAIWMAGISEIIGGLA